MLSWLFAMCNTVTKVVELFLFVSSTQELLLLIYSLSSINKVPCLSLFPLFTQKEAFDTSICCIS